ncbi:MAG: hypothetical protein P8M78_14860 [Myxococcota bacterium]|nr:hypothetical protein [Myxococcota bacterium]
MRRKPGRKAALFEGSIYDHHAHQQRQHTAVYGLPGILEVDDPEGHH